MKHLWKLLSIDAALALVAGACGGDDDESADSDDGDSSGGGSTALSPQFPDGHDVAEAAATSANTSTHAKSTRIVVVLLCSNFDGPRL